MSSDLEHRATSVLLIIDTNEAARSFYADGLNRCDPGYLIIEAGDEQTARQIAGCMRVDCVVLELALSDKLGLELLQHFGRIASRSNVPVIVLTMIKDPGVLALAKQSGAQACLDKAHTTPEDLDRAIHRAIAFVGQMPKEDWYRAV
jgi:DNA-binding NarL/FixJ family response regulator